MRVLLPKRYLKGIIAFLLFLIGTVALVGATLPASFQKQIGLSPSGSIFEDLFYTESVNPFLRTASTATANAYYAPAALLAGNPAADLDQCANDPLPSSHLDGCNTSGTQWVNGNLGASKSVYFEGDSIPYRMKFSNLPLGQHTVTIEWDTTKSGKHAIDYITNWNQSVADANPCLGISGCIFPGTNTVNYTELAIAPDPQVTGAGVTPIAGKLRLYGGTLQSMSSYSYSNGSGFAGDKSASITVTFTASVANPVLAWGGHISTRKDWGDGGSAVAISGSPYHTRLLNLDGSGGNQDRSLSADAVIFPGSVTIIKDRIPNGSDDFSFTDTGLSPASFNLDDDSDPTLSNTKVFSNVISFGTKTVTEASNSAFILSFTSPPCTLTSPNGGDSSSSGNTVTINMKEGENYTCTFTNTSINDTNGRVIVKKVTVPSGDTNTDFTFNTSGFPSGTFPATFTEKDGGSKDSCGAGINCVPPSVSNTQYKVTEAASSTYTLTKKECVSSDSARPNSDPSVGIPLVAGETVTCTFTNTLNQPALTIDKVATESGFSKVGDVIHYTITVKNTGNVTLPTVTVTDTQVTNLSCTPANGSSLAPNDTMTCTASHTITQADLDAGSFYNQACADDGDGAGKVCDDVTTPGTKNPHLTIDKNATETGFSKLGDVIHYSITATNDGNVTLNNVTVTDSQVSNLSCSPSNPVASLAPGASITCTASHTITQADLDAGTFYNQACVDDGAGGAASVCDDVTTPGTKNPHLTIDKNATETGFSKLGDVIHYSITATNDGNVTLNNVTVTDSQVSDLTCSPSNPVASLAPGASITCTASHTITQADLDAGTFYNQACVDDGAGGAASVCDDVTTPGTKNPHLTIDKNATETGFSKLGDVIHYSITATNDGNVTLSNVTVTDSQVSNLSCSPSNPVASLAPGASITCTASHTITQADLDAGTFYNQACVDDGAGGAASVCDDVTTPGSKNPHLAITKVATESGFNAVGDVIHYTIVATNDGNVTLANVTVTDSQVSNLSCSPSNPVASLAPGASITCTASHTISQGDLDLGSFYNQACVDDGTGGAAGVCADVTTPGTKLPALSIVKKTNGTDNNTAPGLLVAVGASITWTYDVTNTGNVTLFNIAVTDDKLAASAINCDGDNIITSLAPGASTQCSASGTAIAGQYTNTGTATSGPTHASDPDNYFGQTTNVSGSYPTQTTCQDFISNTVQPQEDGTYGVKNGKINNAAPGVIFYYSRWTPQNSLEYIDQAILSDAGFTQTMTVQSVGLFKAADCSAAPGTVTTNFQVDSIPDPNGIKLTGLTVGLEYVVAVKYSPSSLRGATPPTGGASIIYQFQTRDNSFSIVAKDDNGFTLTLK